MIQAVYAHLEEEHRPILESLNSVGNLLNYSARPVNVRREDDTLAERIVFSGVRRSRG